MSEEDQIQVDWTNLEPKLEYFEKVLGKKFDCKDCRLNRSYDPENYCYQHYLEYFDLKYDCFYFQPSDETIAEINWKLRDLPDEERPRYQIGTMFSYWDGMWGFTKKKLNKNYSCKQIKLELIL